jgi:hypothetical protein
VRREVTGAGAAGRRTGNKRPPARTYSLGLAGIYYLLAAFAVTLSLWRDPASSIVAANPYDSDQFAWFFRYDATAVAHLRLPALTTAAMNAPQGINLMWNTPMTLAGVLLAPVTLLAGPQASLTVLMTLGFAGSALAMFFVLRRRSASMVAAAAGGLVYGFSPALVQSAQGHYDLQFAVLPPLIVDAAARLATARRGTGRRHAARRGAWLGLLLAAQVFLNEELLFYSVVASVVVLAVLAASRPPAAARRIGDVITGAVTALAVTALLAGYPLAVQFFGPIRQHGSPFTPDYYKNDLAGLVLPSSAMLLHSRGSAAFAAAFQGRPPEYLAYLGWPMLAVLAATAACFWRLLAIRATAVTFAVLEVFSLGGTLLAAGHEHRGIMLPWYWLQTLPVTGSAIPDRFSILADGAAAAVAAFGLDAARARWPGARRPAHAARRPAARWVIPLAALAAIAPVLPRPLPAASGPAVPAGWTAVFAALRIPAGARVLVLPVPASSFTEPLRWQADTGVPSSIVGGYFMGPDRSGQAATDGGGLSPVARYLNQLWARSSGSAGNATFREVARVPSVRQVTAQLAAWSPAAIVAVASAASPLGQYLTGLLGPPAARAGGVIGWRLVTAAQQVVQEQELGDRQGLAALSLAELAQAARRRRGLPQPAPDGLLDHRRVLSRDVAVDVQRVNRAAVGVPRQLQVHGRTAIGVMGDAARDDAIQVRVPDRGPQHQLR